MYVVALFTAGKFPRVTGEFGLLVMIGEDTFGYRVHSTLSTVIRSLVIIVPGH